MDHSFYESKYLCTICNSLFKHSKYAITQYKKSRKHKAILQEKILQLTSLKKQEEKLLNVITD